MNIKSPDEQWRDVLKLAMAGAEKENRTDDGTTAIFAPQMLFDLSEGFPIYTLKEVNFDAALDELLWFRNGGTNVGDLNSKIWDQWALEEDHKVIRPIPAKQRVALLAQELECTLEQAQAKVDLVSKNAGGLENFYRRHNIPSQVEEIVYPKGELGPIYGRMWTKWPCTDGRTINQIQYVEDQLRNNPNCRRILWHGWNPQFLPNSKLSPQENVKAGKQALPPCHLDYIFTVIGGKLNLHVTMRSNDLYIGNPFNTTEAALWVFMFCEMFDHLEPGYLSVLPVDCHVYDSHRDAIKKVIRRKPRKSPKLKIKRKVNSIFDYRAEDFELVGYKPHPNVPAPVAK